MSKILICLAAAGLLAAAPVSAETVDLPTALAAAVAHRPLAEAARQQAAGARAAVTEARSGYLPQLRFEEAFQATNEPGGSLFMSLNQQRLVLSPTAEPYNHPPSRHDYETRFTLDQSLFDPELGYGLDRAKLAARAAGAAAGWSEEQAAFAAFRPISGCSRRRRRWPGSRQLPGRGQGDGAPGRRARRGRARP